MGVLSGLTTYISANLVSIAVRMVPAVLFAGVVLIQWYTSSSLQRAGLIAVAVAAVVAGLDIAGKLPPVGTVGGANSKNMSETSES